MGHGVADAPCVIQVVYDGSSPSCLKSIQLVQYRDSTLPVQQPTVALYAWPSAEADAVLRRLPANQKISGAEVRGRVVAYLPTGLVLPHCEEDVMRLIYEMEYNAFVRAPDPTQIALLDQRYFSPIRQAQAEAVSEPWWNRAIVFRLVAQALRDRSFCVLDNFLSEHTIASLHRAVYETRPEMVRGATGAAGKVLNTEGYTEKLEKTLNEPSRGDLIKFDDDGKMPGCAELQEAVDGLLEGLKGCDSVAERLRFVDFANGAMFSIYPGGASRYIKHVDNTLGTDGRRLTTILYLNKDWEPGHGGQLRIFEPSMQSMQVKADVNPVYNRLLLFWSNQEVPHEVLCSYKDRAAVSIWYLCGRESLGNQDAFERLFNPEKVRVVTGKKRGESILRAAETEAQRQTLGSVPCGNEDVMKEYTRRHASQLSPMFKWRSEDQVEKSVETESDRRIKAAIAQALEGGRSPEEAFGQLSVGGVPESSPHGGEQPSAQIPLSQCPPALAVPSQSAMAFSQEPAMPESLSTPPAAQVNVPQRRGQRPLYFEQVD